ncbi:hypothetical protein CDL12_29652 [Handroanthus impetiginosus]|uniref:Uncharacterized protein n=1 Tax=Handroanthus impetiginosus TaxID=429701 RepID=A0A2G9FXT4_9LAMI|nr:hypothetical protein CDL12_29652 [Handroanthus impetiginosus]
MGEAVVSSEAKMELKAQENQVETEIPQEAEKKNKKKTITADGGAPPAAVAAEGASSVVKWERFLPKMVVRVLLVEADDSTRQIIAALLRKCSYKVAAVPDGLKAWEVLKGRPHNIDLILTEVELPSISGYALLTLIMEHEVCKNIPVIMMSSHDSVSTVYKCMLRGATDFLVKPIRKNELRNLWQHVWRKQASNTAAGLGPPDESVAQQKDEATSENNATSNHSSGYRECNEKGSDAQSSCTKPELENEGEDTDHVLSQLKSAKRRTDNINTSTREEYHQESVKRRALDNDTEEVLSVASVDANHATTREDKNSIGENTRALENSSREAIDLIGAFDNHLKEAFASPVLNVSRNKFDILPMLDLSLRRSHNPSGCVDLVNDGRPGLNHSNASPFSRYISKPLPLRNSTSPKGYNNQQKDQETNSGTQLSNQNPGYNSDARAPTIASEKHDSTPAFSYPENKEISHPIPVRGVRVENVVNTYASVMPSMYSSQSGPSPLPSPGAWRQSESLSQLDKFYPTDPCLVDQRISSSVDQMDEKQAEKVENLEDQGLVSPGNDHQSGNSSFCNGNIGHHQSTGSASNGDINFSVVKVQQECGNEESFHVHDRASRRSVQREAALTKFRLKRKDRCFEKKVRYESRKKLAEQRPRVKGQFVRQMPNDPQPENSPAG